MKATTPLTRFVLSTFLLATAGIGVAQGPPGRDPYNPPPGHGGVPPGQAKKHGGDEGRGMPPGQAKKYGDEGRGLPPGQAKKLFRDQDRANFYVHYRRDADRRRGPRGPGV